MSTRAGFALALAAATISGFSVYTNPLAARKSDRRAPAGVR